MARKAKSSRPDAGGNAPVEAPAPPAPEPAKEPAPNAASAGPEKEKAPPAAPEGEKAPAAHLTNCLVCGQELVYFGEHRKLECFYCKETVDGNAQCTAGHFVCDRCHGLEAAALIEQFCLRTDLTDPLELAATLMRNPAVKMHGPEHHYMVPAVLLTAYYNKRKLKDRKPEKLAEARKRAANVPGGFCGFYGDCGAAVGTGIFVSLLTGATPLSKKEWRLSNLMTATALTKIAELGGPRCCKRATFLALSEAIKFVEEHFGTKLETAWAGKCGMSEHNKECLLEECPFFGQSKREHSAPW